MALQQRHQVFVSSTYHDLKLERQLVLQTLLSFDCIPAGMELFPAANSDPLSYIKGVIDNSDYYVLVVANRYGSLMADGTSFTEAEYNYALQRDIPIIACLRTETDEGQQSASLEDPEAQEKLTKFKTRLKDRLVGYWDTPEKLALLVMKSLTDLRRDFPRAGWVKGDAIATEEILLENARLRTENDELRKESEEDDPPVPVPIEGIASLDTQMTLTLNYFTREKHKTSITMTWRELFTELAPSLQENLHDRDVRYRLVAICRRRTSLPSGAYNLELEDHDFYTVRTQLQGYGLVRLLHADMSRGRIGTLWILTRRGMQFMLNNSIVLEAET